MKNNIIKIAIIFLAAVSGVIFADQILWPVLYKSGLVKQNPVYVTETKQVIIQENAALTDAVSAVKNTVVKIAVQTKAGAYFESSGFIATNDGLVVTLASVAPQGAVFSFFVNGEKADFQIVKKDYQNNLALIKLEKSGLPTAGFGDFSKVRLGQRVFMVASSGKDGKDALVNDGIVRGLGADFIQTNIAERSRFLGSPLFDIRGEVIGLNYIDGEGKISAIPVSIIKQFIGL